MAQSLHPHGQMSFFEAGRKMPIAEIIMTLTAQKATLKKITLTAAALSMLGACSSLNQSGYSPEPKAYSPSAQAGPQVKQTDFWSIMTGKTRTGALQRPAAYAAQQGLGAVGPVWSDVYSGQLRAAPQPNYNFAAARAVPPAFNPHTRMIDNRRSAKTAMIRPRFKHFLDGGAPIPFSAPAPLAAPRAFSAPQNLIMPVSAAQAAASAPSAAPASVPAQMATMPSAPTPALAERQAEAQSLSYVKMGGGSQIADWQACETQAGGYFIASPNGFSVEPGFDSCMRAKGYKPEAEAQAELELAGEGAL